MKITDNKEGLVIALKIEVAAADYAEIERKKLAECRRRADFKGFRKGNVPMSLVQRLYGDQILAESVNDVIGEQLQKYIDDNKLHVLGEPLSSENQPENEWKSGCDFTFNFDIAIAPEVSLEVVKEDTVNQYKVTPTSKEIEDMKANYAKWYEEKKEEKSPEDIEKEVLGNLESSYKSESDWRLNKDIRDYFVKKAGVELPVDFLKRWLLEANKGKVTKEEIDKEFDGFAEDFKWQLVRGFLMKKYGFEVKPEDIREAAMSYVTYQYAMYGIPEVASEQIEEAVKNVLNDQKQVESFAEKVEDKKVFEKIREEITIKSKKISSEKFRELK